MSKETTNLAITPKRLGLILMLTYCARCFWYLLRQKFHPPFNHFGGGIFKQMEQAQMAIIGRLLERDGALPEEFAPFCDLVSRVEYPRNWQNFKHRLDSGVLLYGEPDDICNVSDGSIAVLDYKTAKPKDGMDPFLPCYQCQVVGYSYIAEFGLKLGEVSKGGLLYWSAENEKVVDDSEKYYRSKKLLMPFVPKPVAVDIDYELLDAPLKEAVKLWAAKTPPDRTEKCDDCKKLDALLAIEAEAQKLLNAKDQLMLSRSGNDRWVRNRVEKRTYSEALFRSSALSALQDEADSLAFADDGMISNWETFEEAPLAPEA